MPRDGVRDESRHARASTLARAKHVSPSSPTRGIHGARHRASSPRQRASTPMTRAADRARHIRRMRWRVIATDAVHVPGV